MTNTKVTQVRGQWRAELTPQQYHVLREKGTERPFSGELVNDHRSGVYRCAGCGTELFASDTKFESGTGWPSFYQPAADEAVDTETDRSFFMSRTEVYVRDLRRPPGPRVRRRASGRPACATASTRLR